ncbi:phytanoyl-CoA dioxygenase family protein [Tenacibaculum sp. C7A-26P2]|uniref:phytanoyl-CoA dioxygenase family protein n=1 Tax=Tenacibaculum sp. C7A-26P2 TaxID=3447504 RepID=UPI003F880111
MNKKFKFSAKIGYYYIVGKAKVLHPLLPKKLKNKLPIGWNFHMFWKAFKTGGTRIYNDYYSEMKMPSSFTPKTTTNSSFSLSEKDIKFFYENGYVGPFDLISSDEAEKLKSHLTNTILNNESKTWKYEFEDSSGLADELFPDSEKEELTEEYKKKILSHVNKTNRHFDSKELLNIFKKPEIVDRCAQLLGEDLLLWRTDCFEVPGKSPGTPWHQSSNWLLHNMRESVVNPPNNEELFQLTCWIALTDANKVRGCMRVIPGSHKKIYPLIVERETSKTNELYRYDKGTIDFPFENSKEHLIEAKAGQFFLFTERVIHGSVPNSTEKSRWAINSRVGRTNTRFYTKSMLEEGHQITYHKVKNVSLDQWKAILLKGKDTFKYNRL